MKISIILMSYNHAEYIRQCVESILIQKTELEIEIIVADDCSTDDTLSIIREVAGLSSFRFIFLPNKNNLGFVKNYQRAFEACDGNYIAIIESDDYWTDPDRLQKHVNFLESHRECAMTMNRFIEFHQSSSRHTFMEWPYPGEYKYITAEQLAIENQLGNLSACVFRKTEVDKLKPGLFDMEFGDWIIGMALGQYGLVVILKDIMSVYRKHKTGLWSGMNNKEQLEMMNTVIDKYDKYLDYKYTGEFTKNKDRINGINLSPTQKNSLRDFIPAVIIYAIKLLVPKALVKFLKK